MVGGKKKKKKTTTPIIANCGINEILFVLKFSFNPSLPVQGDSVNLSNF